MVFLREVPPEFLETDDDRQKAPAAKEAAKDLFAAMRMAAG
jgi:hypothetical protein